MFEHTPLTLAAAGASGAWVWDIVQDSLHVDARFAKLYGLDPAEALEGLPSGTFFKAIHPADRPRIRIAVAGIVAGAELFSKEFRVIAPDGSVLWMHGRGQSHFDQQDNPVRFTGLFVDVTERKRTEERLRVAQTAGGIGTFEYIDGYATVTVSEEFCRLLGLHPAQVLPVQTINSIVAENEQPLIPEPRGGNVPTELDAVFQITRADNGSQRWIARRGEIVREGSGYRLIGVIYDVTAAKQQEAVLRELNDTLEHRVEQEVAIRQKAEDTLRQAYKMEAIGQLTGGIAHDFNNLLMAISSSLALLEKRIPSDPDTVRLIRNAQQGATRGAALTQRMLAFARRQDLTPEPVDIAALVKGIADLIERTLGPAWPIELGFPDALPPVFADSNQLEMALLNLSVNARDAMPDGGVIHVAAEERTVAAGEITDLAAGHYVMLSVIDAGIGMDDDTLLRATDPFFTTKGVGKGTGLGLSMIHGLARQLKGTFILRSALQEGTKAELWLPATDRNPVTKPAPASLAPAVGAGDKMTILAVDDDGLILMNTATMLEDLGHKVFEAYSGETALEILQAHPEIDLIITDQAMPNMMGTQLAERVALDRPEIPVILATGYGDLPDNAPLRMTKLNKPFDQAMLAKALDNARSPRTLAKQPE